MSLIEDHHDALEEQLTAALNEQEAQQQAEQGHPNDEKQAEQDGPSQQKSGEEPLERYFSRLFVTDDTDTEEESPPASEQPPSDSTSEGPLESGDDQHVPATDGPVVSVVVRPGFDPRAPQIPLYSAPVKYDCVFCQAELVVMSRYDALRCRECGCTMMYKQTTKRLRQFFAR